MIVDVTGIELLPGNNGIDCKGNGEHIDEQGNIIECCCDECDYFMCCLPNTDRDCKSCLDTHCPKNK